MDVDDDTHVTNTPTRPSAGELLCQILRQREVTT